MRRVIAGLACCLAVSSAFADEPSAAVPLNKVVMFNSGVGFFEHRGEVQGNARLELKFNVDDVNDLLKSMVLQDLGGGKVSTVNYDSKDPITKTLRTFAIDLTSNPTLAQLLSQVRGEKVQVSGAADVTGIILGVETRKQKVGDTVQDVEMLNLLTDDGLRSLPLASIGQIKFVSQKLDSEFRQALLVLASAHTTDKKSVVLNFTGEGKRSVRVGYIQEAPIWKTSYRLVLNDKEEPFLQGWAIVENTTEADWNKVDLTLVSGRPISFIMDLYQPLYLSRPVVVPELFASLRPQTYDQDLARRDKEFEKLAELKDLQQQNRQLDRAAAKKPAPAADARARGEGKGGGLGGQPGDDSAEARFNIGQGVQSAAQTADVGELFEYKIENPVTLPRQQSAMLPIVNGKVQAEKVSIYNQGVHAKHPLNGLVFTNSTGLHLMQGPITVFDEGTYAGDAQIQDLQPGTRRLISYAMDLGTEVAPGIQQHVDELTAVKLVKGTMHVSRKFRRSSDYTVKNSGSKAKKVLIEYPLDTAWNLITPAKPEEKTRDKYRFAVAAEPGKPSEVKVLEERTATEYVTLTNLDDESIRFYIRHPIVSQKVKDALAEVIKRKVEILATQSKHQELQRQVTVIDQEQGRIRGNMAQLDRKSDLYNRYVKKFGEQEDQMDKLRTEIQGLILTEQKQRADLDRFLVTLELA